MAILSEVGIQGVKIEDQDFWMKTPISKMLDI